MPLEAVPTLQSIAKGIDLLHQISDLAKRFEPNYYKFIRAMLFVPYLLTTTLIQVGLTYISGVHLY